MPGPRPTAASSWSPPGPLRRCCWHQRARAHPRSGTLVLCPTVLPEGGGAQDPAAPARAPLDLGVQPDRERKSQPTMRGSRFSREGAGAPRAQDSLPPGSVLPAPRLPAPVVLTARITVRAQTEDRGLEGPGSGCRRQGQPGLRLAVKALTLTSRECGHPHKQHPAPKIVGSQWGLRTARLAHSAEGSRASFLKTGKKCTAFSNPDSGHPKSRPLQPLLRGHQADCPGSRGRRQRHLQVGRAGGGVDM